MATIYSPGWVIISVFLISVFLMKCHMNTIVSFTTNKPQELPVYWCKIRLSLLKGRRECMANATLHSWGQEKCSAVLPWTKTQKIHYILSNYCKHWWRSTPVHCAWTLMTLVYGENIKSLNFSHVLTLCPYTVSQLIKHWHMIVVCCAVL